MDDHWNLLNVGWYRRTGDGVVLEVNDAELALLGYTPGLAAGSLHVHAQEGGEPRQFSRPILTHRYQIRSIFSV